jgi:hypothetical protein
MKITNKKSKSNSTSLISILSFSLIAVATLLSSVKSLAAISARETRDLIRQSSKNCPKLNCPQSRVYVRALLSEEIRLLRGPLQAQTIQASLNFARDVWPDGILEGFVDVDFSMKVENVEALIIDGRNAGFRVQFSAPAWEQAQCAHVSCASGKIVDRMFWLTDANYSLRDETFSAQFIKTK